MFNAILHIKELDEISSSNRKLKQIVILSKVLKSFVLIMESMFTNKSERLKSEYVLSKKGLFTVFL